MGLCGVMKGLKAVIGFTQGKIRDIHDRQIRKQFKSVIAGKLRVRRVWS